MPLIRKISDPLASINVSNQLSKVELEIGLSKIIEQDIILLSCLNAGFEMVFAGANPLRFSNSLNFGLIPVVQLRTSL